MTLGARVAYNTFIQFAGKFASTLLGLAAVAVMARYLGQIGFGQYTTAITFLSFFAVVADFGLTLVTSQMLGEDEAGEEKILSNLFGLRLVSALIFLGAAPLAVFFFPYDSAVRAGVLIAAPSFFFVALNQILTGLFQKKLRMDKVSLAEVAGKVVLLAGIAGVVYFNSGLKGIMAVTALAGAINFFFLYWFTRPFAKIKIDFDWTVWRRIAEKSWPLALTIVFNLIYLRADILILSLVKTPAEVGIYGAAYKVIDVLAAIPFMFSGLILPIAAASWAAGDTARFKNILQKSFDALAILALPLAVGAQFVSRQTMVLVAGEEFAPAGPVLRLLCWALAALFLGSAFSHALIAVNRQKKTIIFYFLTSLFSLFGYLFFIPRYSYFGAAWVTIASETAITLASFYLIWKYASFFPNFKVFGKAVLTSLLLMVFLYFLPPLNLFFILILAAAFYFAALYLLGGLSFIGRDTWKSFGLSKN